MGDEFTVLGFYIKSVARDVRKLMLMMIEVYNSDHR